jgi:hypothetical protein
MKWLIWRQHRAEALVGGLVLAALAAGLITVGTIARSRATALGRPGCLHSSSGCDDALNALHRDFHSIPPFTGALIAIPLLAGMFWAAPLVSREYEAGTHRLAWTQSVSPLRWITVKIAIIFAVAAAASLAIGLLATWALDPLVPAFGGRYNSSWYDIQGVVPVACMVFALGVGVALSAWMRRTIPAMALALVVFAAARIPVHWIRPHFAPLASRTVTVPMSSLLGDPLGNPSDFGPQFAPNDWAQGVSVTDASGHPLSVHRGNLGILQHFCPTLQPPSISGAVRDGASVSFDGRACQSATRGINIRERFSYQPGSHFWLIQTVESLIFVGLAAAFVAAAIYAVARRRPS